MKTWRELAERLIDEMPARHRTKECLAWTEDFLAREAPVAVVQIIGEALRQCPQPKNDTEPTLRIQPDTIWTNWGQAMPIDSDLIALIRRYQQPPRDTRTAAELATNIRCAAHALRHNTLLPETSLADISVAAAELQRRVEAAEVDQFF